MRCGARWGECITDLCETLCYVWQRTLTAAFALHPQASTATAAQWGRWSGRGHGAGATAGGLASAKSFRHVDVSDQWTTGARQTVSQAVPHAVFSTLVGCYGLDRHGTQTVPCSLCNVAASARLSMPGTHAPLDPLHKA